MKRLKIIAASLALSLGLAVAAPVAVSAQGAAGQAKADVCAGINVTGGACTDNESGISNIIKVIVQIISVIAGAASVIMIVIAGMKFITSGGDSSKVASAKSTIIYAIVGLIIVAMAQIIVRFVAGKAVGR